MYDYSLEEIIEVILSEAYFLKDNILREYLIKRYMLLNKINKVDKIDLEDFSRFICDILYIDVINGKFKYYDCWVSVTSYLDESVINIVSNWDLFSKLGRMFAPSSNDKSRISLIDSYCEKTISSGKRKAAKIKGIYKKYYYDNFVLSELNSTYGIIPVFPNTRVIGPLKEKAASQRTYEEVCEAYISAMFFESSDNSLLVERDVENFIYRNHKLFFPNTKILGKQKELGGGYIADIILTSEDTDYILEIKNKKDDRLYWQATNYYNLYKDKSDKDIRVVTIAPEYSAEMVKSLKNLSYVDVKKFRLKIENGKIVELFMEDL